jgi:hypothetical protein
MRGPLASVLRLAYRTGLAGAAFLALVLTYWLLRPNLETPVASLPASMVTSLPRAARHDGMSDLIRWRGHLWLAHVASPWHFASDQSRIVLRRSEDGEAWTEVVRFSAGGDDIRDPKLAVIGERLHLYWLQNRGFPEPKPYSTFVSASADGRVWEAPEPVRPEGWLLWRPRTLDGVTHYVTAYWHDHGRAALLRSTDGRAWTHVSDVANEGHIDETGFTFVGRRIVAAARLEGVGPRPWLGDPRGGTLIATADPPYTEWTTALDMSARLDGPRLLTWRGRAYAVARYDPLPGGGLLGSVLSRKRTALYRIDPARLELLTVLPSAGDTSYAGAVVEREEIVVSYYTSRSDRDYPWLLGMLLPSELRLARIPLLSIRPLADARSPSRDSEG